MVKLNTDFKILDTLPTPSKFCVFCGKKPEGKTKEHIIPQWLIKLTGDPNRKIHLGIDFNSSINDNAETKFREFSFKSFQFPACSSCNEEFSSLEGETKNIIKKILKKEYIGTIEINSLLDWFDKVRVGLWLGSVQLDRKFWQVDPNFFIRKRISEKDRCLFVYEFKDDWEGVQFAGFNSPAFQFAPSCFSLTVNNFCFINTSSDFLFSRNIGFPYPRKQYYQQDSEAILTNLTKGLKKHRVPLLRGRFIEPSIELYQPIIPMKMMAHEENSENLWNCDYIKSNCLDYNKGLGSIFYKDANELCKMDIDEEICFSNGTFYDRNKIIDKLAKQVLIQQKEFIKKLPSTEDLKTESRKIIKSKQKDVLTMQNQFINIIK